MKGKKMQKILSKKKLGLNGRGKSGTTTKKGKKN